MKDKDNDLSDLTEILQYWKNTPEETLNEVFPKAYEEIKKLARAARRRLNFDKFNADFQTTILADEVYLELHKNKNLDFSGKNRASFFSLCLICMRRILIDHLRKKATMSEIATDFSFLPVSHLFDNFDKEAKKEYFEKQRLDELQILVEAIIKKLSTRYPVQMQIVILHYWTDATYDEIAKLLKLSEADVRRKETAARALIRFELDNEFQKIVKTAATFHKPSERLSFLRETCGNNDSVFKQINSILKAQSKA